MKHLISRGGGLLCMTVALSACQNLPDYHVKPKATGPVAKVRAAAPVPVEVIKSDTPVAATVPPPAVPATPMIMKPPSPPQRSVQKLADGRDMPAVQGLLASAETRLQQGDLEEAANSLERAQRLAPQSAQVYLKLAETRLRQGRAVEAEQMARKGLGFAQGAALQAALWRQAALAAERQGKAESARQARQKAEQLEAAGDRG